MVSSVEGGITIINEQSICNETLKAADVQPGLPQHYCSCDPGCLNRGDCCYNYTNTCFAPPPQEIGFCGEDGCASGDHEPLGGGQCWCVSCFH